MQIAVTNRDITNDLVRTERSLVAQLRGINHIGGGRGVAERTSSQRSLQCTETGRDGVPHAVHRYTVSPVWELETAGVVCAVSPPPPLLTPLLIVC